jgi:Peptidase inhibitor family I36
MALPPGVVALSSGESCPPRSLCLYRDGNFSGPAYAVGEGYTVDLNDLPCEGGAWGPTMAGNVSSWNN